MRAKEEIKDPAGQMADGLGAFLVWWTLYFVIGFAMAVPYTFLAGWDAHNLFLTAWVLPIASAILYGLYTASPTRFRKIPWWTHRVFWGFLCYCFLPIFANGISLVLKWVGSTAIGGFTFEYRYASLIVVPIVGVVGLVSYSFAKSIWRQLFRGSATPPSSTPPSNDFGPNKTVEGSMREERKDNHDTFQLVSA